MMLVVKMVAAMVMVMIITTVLMMVMMVMVLIVMMVTDDDDNEDVNVEDCDVTINLTISDSAKKQKVFSHGSSYFVYQPLHDQSIRQTKRRYIGDLGMF